MANRKVSRFAYAVFALFLFAEDSESSESKHTKTKSHGTEIHWGYEGHVGPHAWGTLCPQFALCSEGERQSPIDISGADTQHLSDIEFDYKLTHLNIVNNGHTIQINYDKGSSIKINGKDEYELKQFHFHAPSEHTVNGKQYAMELHLVHKNADDELAVVGVLIDSGIYNWSYTPLLNHLPAGVGEELRIKNVALNARNLLPGHRLHYRYDGSLTTPPCTEGVKWFVLTKPITLSDAQITAFKAFIENNNRPVQPLNDREVLLDAARD